MRRRLAIFAVSLFPGIAPAKAESLLIFTPQKLGDRAYMATMGFRLPMDWETSMGADLGLEGTRGNGVLPDSGKAMLWGKIAKVEVTPAARLRQEVGLRYDTLRGGGAIAASRSRSWILTPSLDMQSTRALTFAFDPAATTRVTAVQAVKLEHAATGTSLSVGGGVALEDGTVTRNMSLNQILLPHLDLTASLVNPGASDQSGRIGLNYRVTW